MTRFYFHGFLGHPDELAGLSALDQRFVCVDWFANAKPSEVPFHEHAESVLSGLGLKAGDSLVGYSMGGRLLVEGARVLSGQRIYLLSTHPGRLSPEQAAERRAFAAAWSDRLLKDNPADFQKAWNSLPLFDGSQSRRIPDSVWRDRSLWAEALLKWGPENSTYQPWPPCEWWVGEQDSKYRKLALDCLDPKCVRIVSAAGHRIPWDRPELLVEAIP
jgi:hypothetical protein